MTDVTVSPEGRRYDEGAMTADIRNHNERAVRGEVLKLRYASADDPELCWCPLCEADVISLSLSSLPPCYGREHSGEDVRGRVSPGFVSQVVRSAVDRIARKPKHGNGGGESRRHEVRVVDFAFEAAAAAVEGVLHEEGVSRCGCRDCRADTLTLALNRFSPLYGVVFDGRRYLPAERWQLLQAEMKRSLTAAARVVSSSPYHWVPGRRRHS